jgi:hypothetical protein
MEICGAHVSYIQIILLFFYSDKNHFHDCREYLSNSEGMKKKWTMKYNVKDKEFLIDE